MAPILTWWPRAAGTKVWAYQDTRARHQAPAPRNHELGTVSSQFRTAPWSAFASAACAPCTRCAGGALKGDGHGGCLNSRMGGRTAGSTCPNNVATTPNGVCTCAASMRRHESRRLGMPFRLLPLTAFTLCLKPASADVRRRRLTATLSCFPQAYIGHVSRAVERGTGHVKTNNQLGKQRHSLAEWPRLSQTLGALSRWQSFEFKMLRPTSCCCDGNWARRHGEGRTG